MREISLVVKKLDSAKLPYRVETLCYFYGFKRLADAEAFSKSRLSLLCSLRDALKKEHDEVFKMVVEDKSCKRYFHSLGDLELVLFYDCDDKSVHFERQLWYCLNWFYDFYSSRGLKKASLRIAKWKDFYYLRSLVSSTIMDYDMRLTSFGRLSSLSHSL